MTIYVQNTAVTNTFDFWRNRTNELAYAMGNSAVTVNSNTAVGNAAITGTFTANVLVSNTYTVNTINANVVNMVTTNGNTVVSNSVVVNSVITVGNATVNTLITNTNIYISNSTANINLTVPTAAQIANGQYFHNANGQWSLVPLSYNPISNGSFTTSGTNPQVVDYYPVSTYSVGEYALLVLDNNANNKYASKILTLFDGSNTLITEYADLVSNSTMGTFSANANVSHVRLYFTPVSSNTTVKFVRTVV